MWPRGAAGVADVEERAADAVDVADLGSKQTGVPTFVDGSLFKLVLRLSEGGAPLSGGALLVGPSTDPRVAPSQTRECGSARNVRESWTTTSQCARVTVSVKTRSAKTSKPTRPSRDSSCVYAS